MDLILKEVDSTHVDIARNGKICIQQISSESTKYVSVSLSPEQFNAIRKWYDHNEQEVVYLWNGGVEHGEI